MIYNVSTPLSKMRQQTSQVAHALLQSRGALPESSFELETGEHELPQTNLSDLLSQAASTSTGASSQPSPDWIKEEISSSEEFPPTPPVSKTASQTYAEQIPDENDVLRDVLSQIEAKTAKPEASPFGSNAQLTLQEEIERLTAEKQASVRRETPPSVPPLPEKEVSLEDEISQLLNNTLVVSTPATPPANLTVETLPQGMPPLSEKQVPVFTNQSSEMAEELSLEKELEALLDKEKSLAGQTIPPTPEPASQPEDILQNVLSQINLQAASTSETPKIQEDELLSILGEQSVVSMKQPAPRQEPVPPFAPPIPEQSETPAFVQPSEPEQIPEDVLKNVWGQLKAQAVPATHEELFFEESLSIPEEAAPSAAAIFSTFIPAEVSPDSSSEIELPTTQEIEEAAELALKNVFEQLQIQSVPQPETLSDLPNDLLQQVEEAGVPKLELISSEEKPPAQQQTMEIKAEKAVEPIARQTPAPGLKTGEKYNFPDEPPAFSFEDIVSQEGTAQETRVDWPLFEAVPSWVMPAVFKVLSSPMEQPSPVEKISESEPTLPAPVTEQPEVQRSEAEIAPRTGG